MRRVSSSAQISVLKKVKSTVAERRIRVSERFQDFDLLRKGVCTCTHLKTALTVMGIELDTNEYATLFDSFKHADGMFCYRDFCNEIDSGCADFSPSVDLLCAELETLQYKKILDEQRQATLVDIEAGIRRKMQLRRMDIRTTFDSFCKMKAAHVTRSQFARVMAMLGFRLSENHLDVLCWAYCCVQDGHYFNYLRFCASVDPGNGAKAKLVDVRSKTPEHPLSRYFSSDGSVIPLRVPPSED